MLFRSLVDNTNNIGNAFGASPDCLGAQNFHFWNVYCSSNQDISVFQCTNWYSGLIENSDLNGDWDGFTFTMAGYSTNNQIAIRNSTVFVHGQTVAGAGQLHNGCIRWSGTGGKLILQNDRLVSRIGAGQTVYTEHGLFCVSVPANPTNAVRIECDGVVSDMATGSTATYDLDIGQLDYSSGPTDPTNVVVQSLVRADGGPLLINNPNLAKIGWQPILASSIDVTSVWDDGNEDYSVLHLYDNKDGSFRVAEFQNGALLGGCLYVSNSFVGIQNGTNRVAYPHVAGNGTVTWTTTPTP